MLSPDVIVRAFLGKIEAVRKLEPVTLRQWLQWHTKFTMDGLCSSYVTLPHIHAPVEVLGIGDDDIMIFYSFD